MLTQSLDRVIWVCNKRSSMEWILARMWSLTCKGLVPGNAGRHSSGSRRESPAPLDSPIDSLGLITWEIPTEQAVKVKRNKHSHERQRGRLNGGSSSSFPLLSRTKAWISKTKKCKQASSRFRKMVAAKHQRILAMELTNYKHNEIWTNTESSPLGSLSLSLPNSRVVIVDKFRPTWFALLIILNGKAGNSSGMTLTASQGHDESRQSIKLSFKM